jgi:hypothetical protein
MLSSSGFNAGVACCRLDDWRSENKLSGLVARRWSSLLLVVAVVGLAAVVRGVCWWRPVCEPVGVVLAAALAKGKKKNIGRRLGFQREGFRRWLRESRFSCLGERPFGRELAEGRGRSVCRGGWSVWLRVRATNGKMAGAKMGVDSSLRRWKVGFFSLAERQCPLAGERGGLWRWFLGQKEKEIWGSPAEGCRWE